MSKIKNWFVRHKELIFYILKRIGVMLVTFLLVTIILFILIRLLVPPVITYGPDREIEEARREALGYNESILVQLLIFFKNIFDMRMPKPCIPRFFRRIKMVDYRISHSFFIN